MPPQDPSPFRLEITEDLSTGIKLRIHHNGGIPEILKDIPKDVLRKARPWIWSSYERRILRSARHMAPAIRRAVRDVLVLERSKLIMARPPPKSWRERRRLWKEHRDRVHDATLTEVIKKDITLSNLIRHPVDPLQGEGPPREEFQALSLSEQMREMTGADVAQPRPADLRERSR